MSIDEQSTLVSEEQAPVPETDSAEHVEVAPRPKALPVAPVERVASVDVIRGVALMGILAMNIVAFAWPGQVYSIPIMAEGAGSVDTGLWAFNHLVFDTKMMSLFSMLFGAGLVLMSDRAEKRGAKIRGTYYRRVTWLLVIGLIHSYLIWDGDILVMYASCGFLLYLFRKMKPKTLIIVGTCFNLVFIPLLIGFRFGVVPYMKTTAARVEAESKVGKKPTEWEKKVRDGWKEMSKTEMPKREDFLKSIAEHRSGYWSIVKNRASQLIWGQTLGFLLFGWWLAGGRMMIGMGLMKLDVFSARLSSRTYWLMMLLGYGIGLPLMAFDVYHEAANGFFLSRRMQYALEGWPLLMLYGSIPVVFGHIGAVMLICKSGSIPWLTRRLAACGRMALSLYLFDSLFCTTLFYGYGLDFFGSIHRPLLYGIVATIWIGQLLLSPLWLEHFRFGPAEWLWRSLTYWKLQPFRRRDGDFAAA